MTETDTYSADKQGLLVAALAKAKQTIKAPKKGRTAKVRMKTGGEYSYSYADRADVIEAYQKALADNGLAIVHTVILGENLQTILCSRLVHSGGGEIISSIPIPACDDARVLGSWLSYLERYQSSALLDIAAEDDNDGEGAVRTPREEPAAARPTASAATLSEDGSATCPTCSSVCPPGWKNASRTASHFCGTCRQPFLATAKTAEEVPGK